MTQNVPVSLKVYKIMSHSKRTWIVCMAGPINGTLSWTPRNVRYEPSHVSVTYFRYDYKLNNNSLKHVTQVKDFGVTISSDLTWDTHINTILGKAKRMLAFLRHNSVVLFTTHHSSPSPRTRKFGSNTHLRRINETCPTLSFQKISCRTFRVVASL